MKGVKYGLCMKNYNLLHYVSLHENCIHAISCSLFIAYRTEFRTVLVGRSVSGS
jgi:hypothetical protein